MKTRSFFLAATLVLVAASAGWAQLVGYWKFDGDALDASTFGNDATLNGDAGFSANVPAALGAGSSLMLDGDGDYASIAADSSLDSPVFTLSYWINQNGATQNGSFERTTSRGGDTFETAVNGSSAVSFFQRDTNVWTTTSHNVPASSWQHLAVRADGANVQVFADGNLVHTSTGIDLSGNPPSGVFHIGARHNTSEGFQGLMDDVSLFNTSLNGGAIALMANGTTADAVADSVIQQTIVSNTTDWSLSTIAQDGGSLGDWNNNPLTLPDVSTYTLSATTPAVAGIDGAAPLVGAGAEPISADNDIRFYRTTFDLDSFSDIAAQLSMAVDNGAAIFINGEEIARETSFVTENWAEPLPGLTIQPDGTIDGVVKFDFVDPSFSGFVPGTNELVLAIRNPNSESDPAGGFAFRLDVATTAAIPEPTSVCVWAVIAVGLAGFGCYRVRRKN